MNKEEYVKFSNAKRLKEKGFDWKVRMYYAENGDMLMGFLNNFNSNALHGGGERVSAPTQQMACRWLREEKHIFIGKSFAKNKETLNLEFYSPVFNMDTGELITTIGAFCPEDAIEGALQYVLTNLI